MATYCSASDIASFMNLIGSDGSRLSFDATTTPTDTEVESIIEMAEDIVDKELQYSWRSNVVTDEVHHLVYHRNISRLGYYSVYRDFPTVMGAQYLKLNNAPVRALTELLVYDGTQWIDYVASRTESTNPFDEDYYVNYVTGEIYINDFGGSVGQYMVKASYTWGDTSSVPTTVKQATILIASAFLMDRLDMSIVVTGGERNMYNKKPDVWREEAIKILQPLKNNYQHGAVAWL